jgi:hypothetical protein
MSAVGSKVGLGSERHRSDARTVEFIEAVAHGNQVLLARKSHEMSVEDQQHGASPVLAERPGLPLVVREREVADLVSDPHYRSLLTR